METLASPSILMQCLEGYSHIFLPTWASIKDEILHLPDGVYDFCSVQSIIDNLSILKIKGATNEP